MPVPVSSFVGRRAECELVAGLLADHRLVTLTGTGGIGKTRLAIELTLSGELDSFGALAWVHLASTANAPAVDAALLAALDLARGPEATPIDLIVAYLADRTAIVLIDNCEQVVDEVALRVHEILSRCPAVRMLATRGRPLGVDGEATWSVPPLSLPDAPEQDGGDAIALFEARARSAIGELVFSRADLRIVAAICRALEGVPLAIELAAGQLRTSSLHELHDRLTSRLKVLVGGSPLKLARHQAVRASIDWSHELLTGQERVLFGRVSVFAGGWDVEAMRAVCAGDGLHADELAALMDQLVLKSIALADRAGHTTRYALLESVREYARERLIESGEEPPVADRHVGWSLARAAQADREYWALDARRRAVLDRDAANFAAALDRSCSTGSVAALELVGHLATYWRELGALEHGASAVARALDTGPSDPSAARAFALMWHGCFVFHRGDFARAMELLSECERVLEQASSARTEAWLAGLRATITSVIDPRAGEQPLEQACSLAHVAGDQLLVSYLLVPLLIGYSCRDDPDGVRRVAHRASAVSGEIGHQLPQRWVAWSLARQALLAGELECCRGQLAIARELSTHRDPEASCSTAALESLTATYAGQLEASRELAGQAGDLARGGTYWRGAANVAVAMGFLALAEGDLDGAVRWGEQLVTRDGGGAHIPVHGQELLVMAALAAHDDVAMRGRAGTLDILAARFANARAAALARYAAAASALLAEDPGQAATSAIEAMKMQLAGGWRPGAIDSLELISASEHARGRSERAAVLLAAARAARAELGLPRLTRPLPGLAEIGSGTSGRPDQRFAHAWSIGEALTLTDALAYARSDRPRRLRPAAGLLGARGCRPGGRRADKPVDRGAPGDKPRDCQDTPQPHLREAWRQEPNRARCRGAPPTPPVKGWRGGACTVLPG